MPVKLSGYRFTFGNLLESSLSYLDTFYYKTHKFETDERSPFIIDCGSYIGLTVCYFKSLYPNSEILAFEPNPDSFELLKKNMTQNNVQNITLLNAALAEREGEIDFYLTKGEGPRPSWSDSAFTNKWYQPEKAKTIRVKAVKLSSYIDRQVDLIKMDVEGYETLVLKEIKGKLENVAKIFIEFHGSNTNPGNNYGEILDILRAHHFDIEIKQATHLAWKSVDEHKIKHGDLYWLMIYARKRDGCPQTAMPGQQRR